MSAESSDFGPHVELAERLGALMPELGTSTVRYLLRLSPEELERRFLTHARNGLICTPIPKVININRRIRFDPEVSYGRDWTVHHHDDRARRITQLRTDYLAFVHELEEDETIISGPLKQDRILSAGHLPLDIHFGLSLIHEEDQPFLSWLEEHSETGIDSFELLGTELRNPQGVPFWPCVTKGSGGTWYLSASEINTGRERTTLAAILKLS